MFVQVARAGRFGTKGLAITFVSDETDARVLNSVQDRFEVNITELPEEIDVSSYGEFECYLEVGCGTLCIHCLLHSHSCDYGIRRLGGVA